MRYFRAVAEELNFTRAAERLCISQPPLTRQIKQLEDELDVLLFERTPRGLVLTPAGNFFYQHVIEFLGCIDIAVADARTLASSGQHTLHIGFVPSLLYNELPTVIQRLRERHDVELTLVELVSIEQIAALKTHRIDIGFGRLIFDDPMIVQEMLFEESLIAVLPTGHRLEKGNPTLAELANEQLIVYPAKPRPSYADTIVALFQSHGLMISATHEVNGLQTAIAMVASGMGVTLVPDCVRRLARKDVVYRSLADRSLTSPVLLNFRRDSRSELIVDLCDIVRRVIVEHTSI